MMGLLFYELATVAYLLSALLAVLRVIVRKDSFGRAAVFALAAGVLLHSGGAGSFIPSSPGPR